MKEADKKSSDVAPNIEAAAPKIMPTLDENSRAWRAPDFSNQKEALGWSENAFAVPKGMEKQVQFWIDIYSKYTSEQGVIHGSDDMEKIYEVVDLKGLQSERQRQKKINKIKMQVAERLGLTKKQAKTELRYQLGQKDRMQQALYNSGRYMEDMEKIFRDAGLPIELARLPFVESSFNVMARSKVGASGVWQIMPYTARPYHMTSAAVDKRNHPLEATKLAAKLLKMNYSILESWPLAVTGYNHGAMGVKKMTKSVDSRELPDLIENVHKRRSFGFASRNFYASFLAALEVERNAPKYFGPMAWAKPLQSQDLKLPVKINYKDLVGWFDGDDELTQEFNPHLTKQCRRGRRDIPASTVIAVPKEKYNLVLVSLAKKDRHLAAKDDK
jgi:membrane-bound lytic murein transglycosylase D